MSTLFMSEEEFLEGIRNLADAGIVITTGWNGFRAVVQGMTRPMSDDEAEVMKWVFWAGARCVTDAMFRLNGLKMEDEYIKKIYDELGSDAFCRPPKKPTVQ